MNDFIMSECNRVLDAVKHQKDKLPEMLEEAYSNVVRWELASGGEVLHRGYYCPSLIIDIVIGRGGRGKILKRPPSKNKPTYEFGYNAHNDLILVIKRYDNRPDSQEYELIFRDSDGETGISFHNHYPDGKYRIQQISECTYDQGRIKSYALFQYLEHRDEILEMRREDYTYAETTMDVDWLHYRSNMDFVMRHEYRFTVDNRRLIQYTHRELSGNQADPNRVYDVHITRYI